MTQQITPHCQTCGEPEASTSPRAMACSDAVHFLQTTIDHAAWLRENAPLGPMGRRMADAAAEIDRLRAVLAAARCIRHWHDRMIGADEGMVVSAEHVRLLWGAIEKYDAVAGVPADA